MSKPPLNDQEIETSGRKKLKAKRGGWNLVRAFKSIVTIALAASANVVSAFTEKKNSSDLQLPSQDDLTSTNPTLDRKKRGRDDDINHPLQGNNFDFTDVLTPPQNHSEFLDLDKKTRLNDREKESESTNLRKRKAPELSKEPQVKTDKPHHDSNNLGEVLAEEKPEDIQDTSPRKKVRASRPVSSQEPAAKRQKLESEEQRPEIETKYDAITSAKDPLNNTPQHSNKIHLAPLPPREQKTKRKRVASDERDVSDAETSMPKKRQKTEPKEADLFNNNHDLTHHQKPDSDFEEMGLDDDGFGPPPPPPSKNPTRFPTAMPSFRPTVRPTNPPTNPPSFKPSLEPTVDPTTGEPTPLPTSCPTCIPTGDPTVMTECPSNYPSGYPTFCPSFTPTGEPTWMPVSGPTYDPSRLPTSTPSSDPSQSPTVQPSSDPSKKPSAAPTGQPSFRPIAIPSKLPSGQPTTIPSLAPTIDPTTGLPTALPSSCPT
ncbi:MAG: hypothetical protein KA100_03700, partial [Rickettsiales bacterium]|nr:hypothetical protein [Rickettsiales bacterium]